MGPTGLSAVLAILLAFFVVRLDWDEGAALAQAKAQAKQKTANLMGTATWFLVALLDDTFAGLFLLSLIRLADGGPVTNVLIGLPWIATTLLIIKSTPNLKWRDLTAKFADDGRDGFVLASAVMFWGGWISVNVPSMNIHF